MPVRAAVGKTDIDFFIMFVVKQKARQRAECLADDRGDGSAGGAHRRQAAPAIDKERVKNDVCHRADHLRPHGELRLARGLQKALKVDLKIHEYRADRNDAQIRISVASDGFDIRLRSDEGVGKEYAENSHDDPAAHAEEQAVARHAVGELIVPAAERTGEHRRYADARAGAETDENVLRRERQRERRKAVLRHPRHIYAVNNVIESLHQHREHHGHCHRKQQLSLRHFAHTPRPGQAACFLHGIHSSFLSHM